VGLNEQDKRLKSTRFELLVAHLALGETCIQIAVNAYCSTTREARSRADARQVYNDVQRLSYQACLNPTDYDHVEGRLARLRVQLEGLGEVF
jgi:hypothetical protein